AEGRAERLSHPLKWRRMSPPPPRANLQPVLLLDIASFRCGRLPVNAQPARLPDDQNPRPIDVASSSRLRREARVILVVDDPSDTREIYSLYLSSRGFRVPTASDGLSGLDAACRHQPDVIVMDLSMPGVDGIEAMRRLRADPRTSHIPIVLLTAYPLHAVQGGALDAGADDFLTKPCLPNKLERHVRRLPAQRRSDSGRPGARSTRRRRRR